LFGESGAVEVVVGDGGVFESDGDPEIPAAVFGRVITGSGEGDVKDAASSISFFKTGR